MPEIEYTGLKKAVSPAFNYKIFYEAARDPDGARVSGSRNKLVLIVDDDPASAEIRSLRVRGAGPYDVKAVSGFDAALVIPELMERLKGQPPDLVLFDFNMPYIDGLVLARQLQESNPSLNMVCLTVACFGDLIPPTHAMEISRQFKAMKVPVIGAMDFLNDPKGFLPQLLYSSSAQPAVV